MVKAMDCGIVVSEFILQSRYYVRFRTNTLGKGMNSLILPAGGGGGFRRVMVKVMDCGIVVNKFELQSRYYVFTFGQIP